MGWGLQPWGDLKRGEVSTSGEGPHWGSPVGTEGDPHPLWEENTAAVRGSRTEETCTRVPPPALPTQPERVSTVADQCWGLESGVWRADPGRALLWALRRRPVGMAGTEELCKQECLGRRPEPPWRRAPLLSHAQSEDPPLFVASLPLFWPLLTRHKEGLH